MGLSEGKRKQRLIGSASAKNTNWANDTSLPGQKLLSSMGWSAGQGLGNQNNQGSTSHVAVAYKMDNKGIGAHRREKEERQNGRADTWAGAGGDLGGLFERLNKQAQEQKALDGTDNHDNDDDSDSSNSSSEDESEEEIDTKPSKKRKRDGKEKEKKSKSSKSKEEKRLEKQAAKLQKKEAKKARKLEKGKVLEEELLKNGKDPKNKKEKKKVLEKKAEKVESVVNARMASRAKFLRAKRMVGTDALSVNEILGISASSSTTASPLHSGTSTPIFKTDLGLTTSTEKSKEGEDSKKSKKRKRKDEEKESGSKGKGKEKEKQKKKEKKSSKSKSKFSSSSSSSSDNEKDEETTANQIPIQSFKDPSKLSLPTSSDPSLSSSPLNPVSQLSVQAYLSQRLIRKKAEIAKRKREHDEGVWSRVDQSVRAL